MKTKAEIVQRLLEEKKIEAEEAVILLMGEDRNIQYVPYPYPTAPINWPPIQPYWPSWQSPFVIIS